MAELEDLLLEAAGRTGAPGKHRPSRPPSRLQGEGSYSDGSDSEDDSGNATKKPSGCQVPLKKRQNPTDKEDDRGSLEEDGDYVDNMSDGDESDVGSDLYKDEYDREQLAQMTELQREMILSERAQRRDDQRLTERVRAKQSGKKIKVLKKSPDPPSRLRSSARYVERASSKDGALNELRAKRLKQQDADGYHILRNTVGESSVGRDTLSLRRKTLEASQSSDSSQGENQSPGHNRNEESAGEVESDDSDEEKLNNEEALTFEDIKEIIIKRSKLAKWFREPFFEDMIVGCFVRVGIGMQYDNTACYRLCIVKNIDSSEPNKRYRLENKSTHKHLCCTWGISEARWQMALVSDSLPLEEEFNEWVHAMKRDGVRMPSKQDLREKQEAIQKAITFVYSSETVKQMLQEKKLALSRPLSSAAEKERLRREMKVAESKGDVFEVERIKARLLEVEANSKHTRELDSKAMRLAEMNKKNRAENFKNASELKPVNTSLKAGEAGYDPFSRRWTRSKNYYVSNPGGGDETAAPGNGDFVAKSSGPVEGNGAAGEAGLTTTAAALEAAADAGKLIDTKAPVDQGTELNSLHNFELAISLAALQKFGGPQGSHVGYMARKQRIEAVIGCKVPENDGRRHPMTLTISDYKRRRDLF
ncbi:Rtf1-like protein [Thalictrum thalictroides]|uniref:Rtf1-like protein n=1 Tax=Thalictrum thalictroides TaxID=46969 RepID=A0A7J6VSN1_THATH|nr:Rtf1-like protein [Thalictrum thalictroides]